MAKRERGVGNKTKTAVDSPVYLVVGCLLFFVGCLPFFFVVFLELRCFPAEETLADPAALSLSFPLSFSLRPFPCLPFGFWVWVAGRLPPLELFFAEVVAARRESKSFFKLLVAAATSALIRSETVSKERAVVSRAKAVLLVAQDLRWLFT